MPIQTTYPVGPGAAGPVIAPTADMATTQAIIAALNQGRQNRNVRHPMEGVGNLAQQITSALLLKKAGDQERTKREAGLEGLVSALRPMPTDPGVAGPARGVYATEAAGVPEDRAMLASLLRGDEGLQATAKEGLLKKRFPGVFGGEADEFTLGPNQVRYRGGEEIARGPAEEPWHTVTDPTELGLPKGTVAQTGPKGQIKVLYSPKTAGGDRPAVLEVADAYKVALAKSGKEISDVEALRWARTSVSKDPRDVWLQVYTASRRAFDDDATARQTASDVVKALEDMGAPSAGEPGPAEGAAETVEAGAAGPGIPRAKPSLAGTALPLPPEPEGGAQMGPTATAEPVPTDAGGNVDPARLMVGQTYEDSDGTQWRWDGTKFKRIK